MSHEPFDRAHDDDINAVLSMRSPPAEKPVGAQSVLEFCEARRLSLRSRLEIVEHVC